MAFYLLQGIPIRQLDESGNPVPNARLNTWAAGTTTPKATYTDSTGATPHTNPIIADLEGHWAEIWVDAEAYKLEAREADNVVVLWQADNVRSSEAPVVDLTSNLSSTTDAAKGAGMVGADIRRAYLYGTVGYKLNRYISVTDFGYATLAGSIDLTGAVDCSAAFQAAHDFADALIGTAAYNDVGVEIYVPAGKYLLTSTVNITSSGVSFVGAFGRGATIVGAIDMFKIGDYTDTYRLRNAALVNLTLYNTDNTNTKAGVTLYRTTGAKLYDLNIVNFNVGIDTYRASTSQIRNINIVNSTRTTAALASMRCQGTDETDTTGDTYTPGGGFTVTGFEVLGSNATVDTTSGILLMACDGFYMSNSHIVGCEREFAIEPDGTPENHNIVDIQVSNSYLDQPSTFAANSYCLLIGGSVKKTIAMADATTQQSIYRAIRFSNNEIRASGYGKNAVLGSITDLDTWATTATQYLEDISLTSNSIKQATSQGIQWNGAALGAYVEPRSLVIAGNSLYGNNSSGGAGSASDINVAIESGNISDNVIGPASASGAAYIISAIISDAGATDNANPSVIVSGNNLSKASVAPTSKYINITPSETGANTLECDNILPGTGKGVDQSYPLLTTDATPTVAWSYVIPDGTAVYGEVEIEGSSSAAARYVVYSWTFALKKDAGAPVLDGGAVTAGRAFKDGTTPAPTLALVGNTMTLTVTGVAATNIWWRPQVRLGMAR